MTTINLPPDLEERVRLYEHVEVDSYAPGGPMDLLGRLAKLLPPPPYVPEVGDLIHAYGAADNDWERTFPEGERVFAVSEGVVVTATGDMLAPRPTVWAYRIDAHRFEKVDEA